MRQLAILVILVFINGCITPRPVTVDEKIVENNPNLIETSPGYYMEFIGLKNYTAQQIVDSMRAKQPETIIGARALNACSAVMQDDLGFEYSSTNYVKPNYGYITLIESKKDYGIVEKELPTDTLNTIQEWNINGKSLGDQTNTMALSFLIQFLRTDGKKISMKMKMIYNQFAEDSEKEFSNGLIDHINSLDMEEALPLAREVLKADGNLVNRYWALLIMMRTKPNDNDLELLFDQYYFDDNTLKSYTSYVLRETLKLRDEIPWKLYTAQIQNLLNGSAIWSYDNILRFLKDNNFDSNYASDILNPKSPILSDYLNAYESSKSKLAFEFISKISSGEVKNKDEANEWLSSQYMKLN
tara:strand:- start:63359 stop:64426 length:1068 start_codon:yes stop_codon:yes gene_type:complete